MNWWRVISRGLSDAEGHARFPRVACFSSFFPTSPRDGELADSISNSYRNWGNRNFPRN